MQHVSLNQSARCNKRFKGAWQVKLDHHFSAPFDATVTTYKSISFNNGPRAGPFFIGFNLFIKLVTLRAFEHHVSINYLNVELNSSCIPSQILWFFGSTLLSQIRVLTSFSL